MKYLLSMMEHLNWFPSLQNLQQVITKFRLQNRVKVSTNIENRLLVNTILPSESIFRKDVSSSINPIIDFLKQNNASLLANFYPYSAYIREPDRIGLRYALFTKPKANPSGYYNLFDAMLDSVYYAIENAGGGNNMEIIVSGSGWPSAGGRRANVRNAATYYTNLLKHVSQEKELHTSLEKLLKLICTLCLMKICREEQSLRDILECSIRIKLKSIIFLSSSIRSV